MGFLSKERARINFYEVTASGYYRFGGKSPEFGSLSSVLHDLHQWSAGKTVETTGLFVDVNASNGAVYLLDIKQQGGNYLIATWNEAQLSNGRSASISRTATVGNASPSTSSIPKNSIPGYATYFWLVPAKRVLATIRFDENSLNGHVGMQRYLHSFLSSASSHARYTTAHPPVLVGYADQPGDAALPLIAKFSSSPWYRTGDHKRIISRASEIRKVMRKTNLMLSSADDRTLWQKLLNHTHLSAQTTAKATTIPIEYEVGTTVTATEVRAMIADFKTKPDSRFEDYGFQFKRSSEVLWLRQSVAKDEISIDVKRVGDATVDAESLLGAIQKQSTSLLSKL